MSNKKNVTKGDQLLDLSVVKHGGRGLFVKEIEQQLLDGTIDLAVHSMKDLPSLLPKGLLIGAVPNRQDARDVLVSWKGVGLDELPEWAGVGTSSLRRSAQLLACCRLCAICFQ
jgi:hydroxymethylbilane synthase